MSRAERWWRPAPRRSTRPAVRSPRRARYAAQEEYMRGFTLGMDVGEAAERQRSERLHDGVQRLTDAIRASQEGDSSLLDELGRQAAGDDLLDVADAAGVSGVPLTNATRESHLLPDVEPDGLVDGAEVYLRTYAAVLDGRTVEQLDDDESRALCTALGQVIAEITAARLDGQGGGE